MSKPEQNEESMLLERFLKSIPQGQSVMQIRRHGHLYYQGEVADAVFFLHSGRVRLVVVSFGGKEATLSVVRPHEFFGLVGSSEDEEHLATAIALTPVTVTRVEHAAFFKALQTNPKVCDLILVKLSSQILSLQRTLCGHLLDCGQQRLARALLTLSHSSGDSRPAVLTPKLSHQMLATMIGTTRARVTSFMCRFRNLGLISPGNPMIVHTSKLTSALHSGVFDRLSPDAQP